MLCEDETSSCDYFYLHVKFSDVVEIVTGQTADAASVSDGKKDIDFWFRISNEA